jgi:hypothetical protein
MLQSIDNILSYKNTHVLKASRKLYTYYDLSEDEASLIFEDLLRFLWLVATVNQRTKENPKWDTPDISISYSMLIIDQFWHTFIMNTKDYMDFCDEYLGGYIHHPLPLNKYFQHKKTLGEDKANEIFIVEMATCVIEYFDGDVAWRWFDEYEKYLPKNAMELLSHHG